MSENIHIIITGGTIDSIFDTTTDQVIVNDASTISQYLDETVKPHFTYSKEILTMKDSRDITDHIRMEIISAIQKSKSDKILITHGTYTMPDTANFLQENLPKDELATKTIVLTGAMLPLKGFSPTDATFNLGFSIATTMFSEPGVYLCMNGKRFDANNVRKNTDIGRFETK